MSNVVAGVVRGQFPYLNEHGSGDTSSEILNHIKACVNEGKIDLKKKFYDVRTVE